jgi:poly(3-hydroxybutyrate) depolymerase
MNRAIYLALFFCSSLVTSGDAQTKYDVSIMVEGKLREFIVSVPSTPPPALGYPLVMMLHGTSGDKDVFYNAKGWKELGELENFVTLFPSSLKWCYNDDGVIKNNSKFVCGDLVDKLCPSDTADLISDVFFFEQLIDRIMDTIPLDTNRIFGSGFSNGCCMILKTGMEAGNIFKAVAGTAGSYHDVDSITPPVRVPVWFMVGNQDDRYIVPPFTEIPYGGDSVLFYLNKPINRTLGSLGLTSVFVKTETELTKTYHFSTCQPGIQCAPYRFTLIKNLPHQYPNGNNHPVDAPLLFWNFFNNPPQVIVSTDQNAKPEWVVTSFPNPSTFAMHIASGLQGQTVRMEMFNQLGMLMTTQVSTTGEFVINKESTGPGIFFLHLESNGQTAVKKIVFY